MKSLQKNRHLRHASFPVLVMDSAKMVLLRVQEAPTLTNSVRTAPQPIDVVSVRHLFNRCRLLSSRLRILSYPFESLSFSIAKLSPQYLNFLPPQHPFVWYQASTLDAVWTPISSFVLEVDSITALTVLQHIPGINAVQVCDSREYTLALIKSLSTDFICIVPPVNCQWNEWVLLLHHQDNEINHMNDFTYYLISSANGV